jgi:hypothetical protein
MKKKLRFTKEITKFSFPMASNIFGGESLESIKRVAEFYDLPKYSTISFIRRISVKKGLEYDNTSVLIEK